MRRFCGSCCSILCVTAFPTLSCDWSLRLLLPLAQQVSSGVQAKLQLVGFAAVDVSAVAIGQTVGMLFYDEHFENPTEHFGTVGSKLVATEQITVKFDDGNQETIKLREAVRSSRILPPPALLSCLRLRSSRPPL